MDTVQIPWPGWKVNRKIGSGGFGNVYEIERTDYGSTEKAALKIISIPKSTAEVDDDLNNGYDENSIRNKYKSELESILKEYKVMTELKGHSNLVSCEDIAVREYENEIRWDIFIRMELLTPLLKSKNTFTEADVIKLGKDICTALIVCEKRNIIHRDIKPANIFLSKHGNYKLGDFGIAKTMDHTTQLTIIGTPNYMAPEVSRYEKYGKEVDIYSLGLVMYWLMNKRKLPFLPFSNQPPTYEEVSSANHRRISGEPLPPPVNASKELSNVILKACAPHSSNRYHLAQEFLEDLERLSSGESVRTDTNSFGADSDDGQQEDTILTEGERESTISSAQENSQEEKPPKNHPWIIPGIIILCVLPLVILIFGICAYKIIIPTQRYRTAVALKESGDYEEAVRLFRQIEDYQDSAALASYCEEQIQEIKRKNTRYTVIVDGKRFGDYLMNDKVEISVSSEYIASDYSCGKNFKEWTIEYGNPAIHDLHSNEISFSMPEEDVSIVSNYSQWSAEPIILTVKNGFGSTNCFSGETITISADVQDGYEFSFWKLNSGIAYIKNENSRETTISFEKGYTGNVEVEAICQRDTQFLHQLTVQSGSGSGSYYKGDIVTVTADQADQGNIFAGWIVNKGNIGEVDLSSETISFSLPDENVELTATYSVNTYQVKVLHGDGDGSYREGDKITISADLPSSGYVFNRWSVEKGSVSLQNIHNSTTSFIMPSDDVTISAEYVKETTIIAESESIVESEHSAEWASLREMTDVTAERVDYKTFHESVEKQILVEVAWASSTIDQDDLYQNNKSSSPIMAADGNEITNWQEGVAGSGIGQSLFLGLSDDSSVYGMSFKLGNWRDREFYYGNNRPKKLTITMGNCVNQIEFPDLREEHYVLFSSPIDAETIQICIDDVYRGDQWDDTVIADISIYQKKEK